MSKKMNAHAYLVILCGGRGSRLWPMSNEAQPKQFQSFLGAGSSLLQQTYRRFRSILPAERIIVATYAPYFSLVQEQLPDLPSDNILLEPTRQDTAPVYARCAYHIQARDEKAVIAFSPCDHFISGEEAFLNAVCKALDYAANNAGVLTMGIQPTHPETEYGYIQLADRVNDSVYRVQTFTEKPQIDLAQVFVDSGEFLWNSGLIFSQAEMMIEAIKQCVPELISVLQEGKQEGIFSTPEEQTFINNHYPTLPRLSFEYGVLEKIQKSYVLPTSGFDWADMGSWSSLHGLSRKDEQGNASLHDNRLECVEASDNLIALSNGKLAILKNMTGYLVAESDKVLLICKRNDVKSVRSLLGGLLAKSSDEQFQ